MARWLVGWLGKWLVGWLASWLVVWQTGWLIAGETGHEVALGWTMSGRIFGIALLIFQLLSG